MRIGWTSLGLLMLTTVSPQAHTYFVGVGSLPCSYFLEAEKNESASLNELVYQSWLQGFYTGVNTVLGSENKKPFDLKMIIELRQNEFMYKWCVANPAKDFKDGALELMGVMPRVDAPNN